MTFLQSTTLPLEQAAASTWPPIEEWEINMAVQKLPATMVVRVRNPTTDGGAATRAMNWAFFIVIALRTKSYEHL